MPIQTTGSIVTNNQNADNQADRILASIRGRPDSGVPMVIQIFKHQPENVQEALLRRLAMEYATSDREYIKKLEAENKRLKQEPHQLGILDEVLQDEEFERLAIVMTHEGLLEVAVSGDVEEKELIQGTRVALSKNGTVIATRGLPMASPAIEFSRMLADKRILAKQGEQHLVLRPAGELQQEDAVKALKPGDLIEYEPYTRNVIRLSEKSTKVQEFVGEAPDTCWGDIGGLDDIRTKIEEQVLGPLIHRQIYEAYGVRPSKGILFEGPPGVGKTLLVKATGRALLEAMKLNKDAPVLFKVKGTALQSSYVGEGPARIRALAATARDAAKMHGLAIIMLDDFEYGGGLHRGLGDRSTPAFSELTSALISEMDGIDAHDSRVVWAATVNRSDLLDSALTRPGRFGQKISVPRPNPDACIKILLIYLSKVPIFDGLSKEELAEQTVQRIFSCDDENLLMRIHYADSDHEDIYPPQVVTGATLAESVRSAAIEAIRRDRLNEVLHPSGIKPEDLCESIYQQLNSSISTIRPSNAHLHYLGLPEDQRVVAVEHVWKNRHGNKEISLI